MLVWLPWHCNPISRTMVYVSSQVNDTLAQGKDHFRVAITFSLSLSLHLNPLFLPPKQAWPLATCPPCVFVFCKIYASNGFSLCVPSVTSLALVIQMTQQLSLSLACPHQQSDEFFTCLSICIIATVTRRNPYKGCTCHSSCCNACACILCFLFTGLCCVSFFLSFFYFSFFLFLLLFCA